MKGLGLPFFGTQATCRAVADARAVAILIGSYDGSGNYGDIAQLDAALQLLASLGPELLALPVLERSNRRGHQQLLETFNWPPEHALYFDPEQTCEDDLLAVAMPSALAAGIIYLYGGGYLNPSWGQRKLAMARAAEDLLQAAGVGEPTGLASGLQVEPGWLAALPQEDAALLRSFEFLGARDPLSARALADLDSPATVAEAGDDAVGAIPSAVPAEVGSDPSTLKVNLHFAEHDWVTERPGGLREPMLDLVAELGRRAERPLRIRPLIAYLDGRIDERPGMAAFAEEAARRGVQVEEPQVLRPADLETMLPELQSAAVTISCSYHVALTSLLLGVPAVVFAANPYYEQKAAGLVGGFGLPPSFAFSPGSDPGPVAAAILDDGSALREEIARGGAALRRTRVKTETELSGRFAAGVLSEMAAEIGRLDVRLQERSAEPAELQAELAALRTEMEEMRRPAVEAAVVAAERAAERADDRARQVEAENVALHQRLAELFGSRSWRLGEPLRRIGRALRRLLRRGRGS